MKLCRSDVLHKQLSVSSATQHRPTQIHQDPERSVRKESKDLWSTAARKTYTTTQQQKDLQTADRETERDPGRGIKKKTRNTKCAAENKRGGKLNVKNTEGMQTLRMFLKY